MSKFHVRFNTKHGGSGLVWRVFEDGIEHLATDVRILGETFTETTQEHGETKWNIACHGRIIWVDQVAVIVAGKD